MEIRVKHGDDFKNFVFDYSIGDVVKIKYYGKRYADQELVFKDTTFLLNYSKNFNANNRFLETEYHKCDKLYGNVEWKIVDIGYYKMSHLNPLQSNCLAIRLTTRIKGEDILFVYYNTSKEHFMDIVRKSKKDMKYCVINID